MSTTISAKIPESLKEELEAEGVNISETVREALEAEVRRRRREELADRASELKADVGASFDADELAGVVESDRREH